MDTHAALTSPFPGTPIYDNLTHEYGITPAGLPRTAARGPFDPFKRPAAVELLGQPGDVVAVDAGAKPARTHPYFAVAADRVPDLPDVDEQTATYPRIPALPLALADR
ncbi:hypothetical protein ABT352_33165 [Streptosporangium sp. NPDC000563]|uniref:hypothetical protein n=1 Tax=Streptosporangium sp. NPDC000563 TaxID=3154366 RepID=UPI00332ED13C